MDEKGIHHAIQAVSKGGLIVYPTDTLYALGASIADKDAVSRIFSVKKRPLSLPLPVAFSDEQMISDYVFLSSVGKRLVEHFLPGQLTLVCKKNEKIPSVVTAGKDTLAVRIPDDDIALTIIKKIGPLVVTSANIHGENPPLTVDEIRKVFKPGMVEVFVDDGPRSGTPSTIVDVTTSQPKMLREGNVSFDEIMSVSDGV